MLVAVCCLGVGSTCAVWALLCFAAFAMVLVGIAIYIRCILLCFATVAFWLCTVHCAQYAVCKDGEYGDAAAETAEAVSQEAAYV